VNQVKKVTVAHCLPSHAAVSNVNRRLAYNRANYLGTPFGAELVLPPNNVEPLAWQGKPMRNFSECAVGGPDEEIRSRKGIQLRQCLLNASHPP